MKRHCFTSYSFFAFIGLVLSPLGGAHAHTTLEGHTYRFPSISTTTATTNASGHARNTVEAAVQGLGKATLTASSTTNGMVRLILFSPNDRPYRTDRVTALRQLTKNVQQFYADQMHRRGFGRKTFTVETGDDGEPVVHRMDGKFSSAYYYEPVTAFKVLEEFLEYIKPDRGGLEHIYLIAMDLHHQILYGGLACGIASTTYYPSKGFSVFLVMQAVGARCDIEI